MTAKSDMRMQVNVISAYVLLLPAATQSFVFSNNKTARTHNTTFPRFMRATFRYVLAVYNSTVTTDSVGCWIAITRSKIRACLHKSVALNVHDAASFAFFGYFRFRLVNRRASLNQIALLMCMSCSCTIAGHR